MMRKAFSLIISILLCIAFLTAATMIWGGGMEKKFESADVKFAEDTVRKYAVQCYALEGTYPENLKYLTDNYTLTLNKEKYIYHYNYIGANIMPEISVFTIE